MYWKFVFCTSGSFSSNIITPYKICKGFRFYAQIWFPLMNSGDHSCVYAWCKNVNNPQNSESALLANTSTYIICYKKYVFHWSNVAPENYNLQVTWPACLWIVGENQSTSLHTGTTRARGRTKTEAQSVLAVKQQWANSFFCLLNILDDLSLLAVLRCPNSEIKAPGLMSWEDTIIRLIRDEAFTCGHCRRIPITEASGSVSASFGDPCLTSNPSSPLCSFSKNQLNSDMEIIPYPLHIPDLHIPFSVLIWTLYCPAVTFPLPTMQLRLMQIFLQ